MLREISRAPSAAITAASAGMPRLLADQHATIDRARGKQLLPARVSGSASGSTRLYSFVFFLCIFFMMDLYRKRSKKVSLCTKKFNSVTDDVALLKHTGCLQDARNSVGCFGDDYHTISEDTGGAWRLLMTCSRCVNRFSIDFSLIFVEFH